MTPQVVLLVAGLGSRFRSEGFQGSKALIDVAGRPMFERALSSLTGLDDFDLITVARADQVANERIDDAVRRIHPDSSVVELAAPTRGAAESAMGAANHLDPDRSLIVLDCDLQFRSAGYLALVEAATTRPPALDVGLLTFPASDPRYSYARTDDDGLVTAVAEKQVISGRAIAGAYLFSTAARFIEAAQTLIESGLGPARPEFYLSAVVQELLAQGAVVRAADVDEYLSFGTPEELAVATKVRGA